MALMFDQNFENVPMGVVPSQGAMEAIFWDAAAEITNPTFASIIQDPTGRAGKVMRQFAPKGTHTPEDSSIHFHCALSGVGGSKPEIYLGYLLYFQHGDSGGQLASSLSTSYTGNITLTSIVGDINDIVVDADLPPGSGSNRISYRDYSDEIIVFASNNIDFEVIRIQGRSGNTLLGPVTRGCRGTTPLTHAAGAKVRVAYNFALGHKLPGIKGGAKSDTAKANAGLTYCTARGYCGRDTNVGYTRPYRYGVPQTYMYHRDAQQQSINWGVSNTPPGYAGGKKEFHHLTWHAMEHRFKMNSAPGVADGEAEGWFDGERVFIKTDICWYDTGATFSKFDWLSYQTHWGGSNDSFNTLKDENKLFALFQIGTSRLNIHEKLQPLTRAIIRRGIPRGVLRGAA